MNKEYICSPEHQKRNEKDMICCAVCGKQFLYPHQKYAYKKVNPSKVTRWACGYNCYRKMCDIIEEERQHRRYLKSIE